MIQASRVAALALLLAGCATQRAPMSNPNGLPPDALTLEYLVERGCMPYALGQKTVDEAMRGVGLKGFQSPFGLMPGDTAPHWRGHYAGNPLVNINRGVCNTIIHGPNVDAYRTATETALRRGLGGTAADDGRSAYKAWVPGQITGCREGVRYTFYENSSGFEVDLTRIADCAHDRLREASSAQGSGPHQRQLRVEAV